MWFIFSLLGLMLAGDIAWWVHAHRRLQTTIRWKWARVALAVFMVVQLGVLVSIPFGRIFPVHPDGVFPRWVIAVGYLWHLVVLPLALLWWVAGKSVRAAIPMPAPSPESVDPAAIPRRQFLGALVSAAPPVLAMASTGVALDRLDEFRVTDLSVAIPNLPADLVGLRVAHISDIHVGRFTRGAILDKIASQTNRLDPDLILFTGDLINNALSDLPAGIALLKNLKSRYGVYLCEGNHDLMESRSKFESQVQRSGLPLLINESAMVTVRGTRLQLLGLRWDRNDNMIDQSVSALASSVSKDAFPILLAHHPHAFDAADRAGIPLTLSGHTHGGQLMLTPTFGCGSLMYRYWSGLYRKPQSRLVVSNGVGNWFPLRLNAPAEIAMLTLQPA